MEGYVKAGMEEGLTASAALAALKLNPSSNMVTVPTLVIEPPELVIPAIRRGHYRLRRCRAIVLNIGANASRQPTAPDYNVRS